MYESHIGKQDKGTAQTAAEEIPHRERPLYSRGAKDGRRGAKIQFQNSGDLPHRGDRRQCNDQNILPLYPISHTCRSGAEEPHPRGDRTCSPCIGKKTLPGPLRSKRPRQSWHNNTHSRLVWSRCPLLLGGLRRALQPQDHSGHNGRNLQKENSLYLYSRCNFKSPRRTTSHLWHLS